MLNRETARADAPRDTAADTTTPAQQTAGVTEGVTAGVTGEVTDAPVRIVTAASLFDGHDAAINIVRRILLSLGAEVIHLGHNRSVADIVTAALQEDAHGIAVSSYQGGHVEFFKYMVDMLRARGGEDIRVFAGGGGVIIDSEAAELEAYGVTRVYSPADGQAMGLVGMMEDALARCRDGDSDAACVDALARATATGDRRALARLLSAIERGGDMPAVALGGHARAGRAAGRVAGDGRCMQVSRFRFNPGRDARHRPRRQCGDRVGRLRVVCDDAGVRRGQPTGENRHARLRRLGRHQQVRPRGR